ncbi:MAG: flagellar biosynthesis protein FlhF [Phycisphaerae bacterium]|jgi:flagellar biosynthesis protein FlhF
MESKTYQAETMSDVLTQVKKDLGRDAVILHTRNFRKGGFLGLGGRNIWEVTAATSINVPSRLPAGTYLPMGPLGVAENVRVVAPAAPVAPPDAAANGLGEKMTEIHQMLNKLLARHSRTPQGTYPEVLGQLQTLLLGQDVAEWVVDDLLAQMQGECPSEMLADREAAMRKLEDLIAARIPVAPLEMTASSPSRPCVVALIGPTGVGKTTTIAKLAAKFKLSHNKRVGLITIDTYRIAAVDQLKIYAQIIDVPLKTVLTPAEIVEAIASMSDRDVILIDTAGRSQNDRLRLNQLRSFLVAAQPEQVHLVMSATASRTTATRIIESFMPLGAGQLIMTKLDEAGTFGMVLNVTATSKMALSYVTTGQEVPDDISAASPRHLANMIVREGSYVS